MLFLSAIVLTLLLLHMPCLSFLQAEVVGMIVVNQICLTKMWWLTKTNFKGGLGENKELNMSLHQTLFHAPLQPHTHVTHSPTHSFIHSSIH